MNSSNFHTLTIPIPIGLHVVTPMSTSSTILDQFSLLFATHLGSLQQAAQRKEITRALTAGPLSEVQEYELNLALRDMAQETAQEVVKNFIDRLTRRLKPELPTLSSPPPTDEASSVDDPPEKPSVSKAEPAPAVPEPQPVTEPSDTNTAQPVPIEQPEVHEPEPATQPEPASKPEPAPQPVPAPQPETKPLSAYTEGSNPEDQVLADTLDEIGRCKNGFAWIRRNGYWQCGGGSHKVYDKELTNAYRKKKASM